MLQGRAVRGGENWPTGRGRQREGVSCEAQVLPAPYSLALPRGSRGSRAG